MLRSACTTGFLASLSLTLLPQSASSGSRSRYRRRSRRRRQDCSGGAVVGEREGGPRVENRENGLEIEAIVSSDSARLCVPRQSPDGMASMAGMAGEESAFTQTLGKSERGWCEERENHLPGLSTIPSSLKEGARDAMSRQSQRKVMQTQSRAPLDAFHMRWATDADAGSRE